MNECLREFLVSDGTAFLHDAPVQNCRHRPVAISVFFLGVAPRRIAHYDRSGCRTESLCNLRWAFVSNSLEGVCMKQNIEELSARFLLLAHPAFFFRHPFEMWQPAFFIDFARHLIMEECQVKAESRNSHGFFIDIDTSDLLTENLAKLGRSYPPAALFKAKMAHD